MKHDIKVFSAIYGDNWQSLNILTTGETFAQNIIVYRILALDWILRMCHWDTFDLALTAVKCKV